VIQTRIGTNKIRCISLVIAAVGAILQQADGRLMWSLRATWRPPAPCG